MADQGYLRDQLLLAQHHVNDASETKQAPVLKSSLKDLDEIVGHLARTLPKQDRVSVAREKLNKEAQLAQSSQPIKFTNTEGLPMTTYTATELRKMAEEADARDMANAFELGFAKAAAAAGLNEAQYQEVRAFGIALLQKSAAESTDTAELAKGRIKTEEKTTMSSKPAKKPATTC